MDWIEEKFENVRDYIQHGSLAGCLIWYLCLGMIGAVTLYWITRNISMAWLSVVAERGAGNAQSFPAHNVYLWYGAVNKERMLLFLLNFLSQYSLHIYTFLNFCIVGKMFLDKKIRPALSAVSKSLTYINMNDYSHEISWQSEDEMGMLCQEIEQLRKNLLNHRKEQWRMQEDQRRINAAFAHDIRTPLTVIRGYTEFLQKYVPQGKVTQEMLLAKLKTIWEQEERLFCFSATMTDLQKMEKWEVSAGWHTVSKVLAQLQTLAYGIQKDSGKNVCVKQEVWQSKGDLSSDWREENRGNAPLRPVDPAEKLFLDIYLFTEVLGNLLNNAARFARSQVEVQMRLAGKELTVFVRDDGPGFSQRALQRGADAYFSEEENSQEHFGIGLSICKILCENHGGRISLQNSVDQGAIAVASLTVGREAAR